MALNREQVIARARRMTEPGFQIGYKLGAGGFKPDLPVPGPSCDCSGFVAWCYGISRKLDHPWYREYNGGWLETSAVYRDATTAGYGFFDQIERYLALPGDVLVWPDQGRSQGHIGIISIVGDKGPLKVIHCSSGVSRKYGHAIAETDTRIFDNYKAIVARPAWLESRRT